jgi:hypothetical protein
LKLIPCSSKNYKEEGGATAFGVVRRCSSSGVWRSTEMQSKYDQESLRGDLHEIPRIFFTRSWM